MEKLAIIIPAYKIDFFRDTLESLANQTCKDFTVYVGDDCSPADFESLVNKYHNRLNIVYKKFDSNLGGKDLVGHWTRCIDLSQGEPWLWLFSDDDVVGSRCVELFYREIEKEMKYDIYHFDVKIIDFNGEVIKSPKVYPQVLSSLEIYKKKASGKIESFVVENIFSRKIYDEVGGFVNFDMAWGSDTATWISMSCKNGMKRIENDYVFWRKSCLNITPNASREISVRKLKANIAYFKWSNHFFKSKKMCLYNKILFVKRIGFYSKSLYKDDVNFLTGLAIRECVLGFFSSAVAKLLFPIFKIIR